MDLRQGKAEELAKHLDFTFEETPGSGDSMRLNDLNLTPRIGLVSLGFTSNQGETPTSSTDDGGP